MSGIFGEVVEKLRRSTVQVTIGQAAARKSGGSGVIWSEDGQIITNAHVVEGAGSPGVEGERIAVEFWDGRNVAAKVLKRDRRRDVAVLQADASGWPAVTPGDSKALRVGELVVAVGNPFGFTGAASTGVIHRSPWQENVTGGFEDRSWVVSQLRLAPGNSGGPLANARGEVVGINTMIAGGLAFAVPSHSVMDFLNAPIRSQGTQGAGLGVVVRPVLLERFRRRLGFLVLEVVPGSPADRSSLLQGDILVGAAGRRFRLPHDLEIALRGSHQGVLELRFRRGASENIRTVAIRMAPASVKAA